MSRVTLHFLDGIVKISNFMYTETTNGGTTTGDIVAAITRENITNTKRDGLRLVLTNTLCNSPKVNYINLLNCDFFVILFIYIFIICSRIDDTNVKEMLSPITRTSKNDDGPDTTTNYLSIIN
jgi:hypothetical protein